MKNNEKVSLLKKEFISNKKNLHAEFKANISSKEVLKEEKSIYKDNYKHEINVLRQQFKNEKLKSLKPEKYNRIISEKEIEAKIVEAQQNYLSVLYENYRKIKKAKRAKDKESLSSLKADYKKIKLIEKEKLNNQVNEIVKNGNVNKVRKFNNTFKVYGSDFTKKVMPKVGKIANQKHLMAIRNAFSSLIPLIMISSFITILRSIPTSLDASSPHNYLSTYFSKSLDNGLVTISSLTMGLMAIGLAFAVGVNLGLSYNEGAVVSGIMGFLGFILWVGPSDFKNVDDGQGLPISLLGSKGLFIALVMSIIMFELYRVFKKYHITIVLPKSVPPAVGNSFIAIIPAVVYSLIVLGIRYVANFDLINEMTYVLKPIGSLINDSFGAVVLIVLFNSLFWWFGIHGSAITGIITYPFWYPAIAENQKWFNGGSHGSVPNMFPEPYYQWCIWIGGAGSTIGLAICSMIFSKSKQNKALSKATSVPALFNISEPMMFGYPVVLNIYFFIPFMFAPVGCAIVSTILIKIFSIHWVVLAPWSLPAPLGAFLAAGNNWFAILVSLVSCGVATAIWYPFYKMYDNSLLKIENAEIEAEAKKLNMSVIDYMKKQFTEQRKKLNK